VLGRALATPPVIVLIEGKTGIGKTRRIRQFLASPAGAKHARVVACGPFFREPHTLGPVPSALREAGGCGRHGQPADARLQDLPHS
jgi:hypothetical protein